VYWIVKALRFDTDDKWAGQLRCIRAEFSHDRTMCLRRCFLALINGMLRSRLASCCLLVVMMFLATALIWNASVDQYVLREGRRVAVPVVDETWNSKSGYTTKYRYPGAGQGNPLHFFDSFFIQSGQSQRHRCSEYIWHTVELSTGPGDGDGRLFAG
jgi:hypothetical protein